jgi:hypothetical protein
MENKLIKSTLLSLTIGFLSSCVNETYKEDLKDDCVSSSIIKNKDVVDLYATATTATQTYHHYNGPITNPEIDDYIEAYVVSSDEGGNFYKNMYLQPLDGSKGLNLSIDEGDMYNKKFEPGRKVFLKLNGLAYANPTSFANGLIIGAPPTDIYAVDRVPSYAYKKHLFSTCKAVKEDDIVAPITLAQAVTPNNIYLNKLVDIVDVQFKSDCANYSSAIADTSLKITSNGSTTLDLRTSKYATFAGDYVPSGRGTIRGVLTKYGTATPTNPGYQLVIRTLRDVKLNGPRTGVIASPPKVGNALVYSGSFTENFTSYSNVTAATFPKYINQVDIGSKYWDITSFGTPTNRYIQTSAFNNGCTKNYFIVPVDLTTASRMSFKTLDGYNNGIPLKVYYSTNYTPGLNMSQATLVDISSNFKFADGRPATATSYASTFTSSGVYNIPAELTGNGYFIFEYDGTTGTTTTYQLDDITVN